VRQLEIKVLNIIDARCNHEVQTAVLQAVIKHCSDTSLFKVIDWFLCH